nr:barstar family protein [uncultured Massilia sp.]
MNIIIDGNKIKAEQDFHNSIRLSLGLRFYGSNREALRDMLSGVDRPLHFRWINADSSRVAMGSDFEKIVDVLSKVAQHDMKWGPEDRFTVTFE